LGKNTYFFKTSAGSGSESVIKWYGPRIRIKTSRIRNTGWKPKGKLRGKNRKRNNGNIYHKLKTAYAYGTGIFSK
jgi:hypothetical protein